MTGNVSDFMDTKLEDVKDYHNPPDGVYYVTVTDFKAGTLATEKATPVVEVNVFLNQPDGHEVENWDDDLLNKKARAQVWMSEKAKPRAKQVLVDVFGVAEGVSFSEGFQTIVGNTVRALIKNEERKDGGLPRLVVERFLPPNK